MIFLIYIILILLALALDAKFKVFKYNDKLDSIVYHRTRYILWTPFGKMEWVILKYDYKIGSKEHHRIKYTLWTPFGKKGWDFPQDTPNKRKLFLILLHMLKIKKPIKME